MKKLDDVKIYAGKSLARCFLMQSGELTEDSKIELDKRTFADLFVSLQNEVAEAGTIPDNVNLTFSFTQKDINIKNAADMAALTIRYPDVIQINQLYVTRA